MKKITPLHYLSLRQTLDPKQLEFKTTAELESLTDFVGQERALQAILFGIGIKSQGYNLYAMGPSGIGKRSLIKTILKEHAASRKIPPDWCYIHNFKIPEKPIALKLPPGYGFILQQDMKNLIEELSASLPAVFESDEFQTEMEAINHHFNEKRKLHKKKIKNANNEKIPHLYKDRHEKEKQLQQRLASTVVGPLLLKLQEKHAAIPKVVLYLQAVQKDIVSHVNDLIKVDENTEVLSFNTDSPVLLKYQVNLLVDNGKRKRAPVIFEENPSYSNLICRVEHAPQNGTLVTNFTLIKSGSLHRANGGYLVIEARKLKKNHEAWEALKRALYSRKIKIDPIEHYTETARPVSLEPVSIPLNIKIILLGDRRRYYSFCDTDPDFAELFKVPVDFDEQITRNKKNIQLYARLIGTIAKREKLRPFHAKAVASIIDYSSWLAEDIDKLSTHVRSIDDLIIEADYWAGLSNKKIVDADDIKKAIEAQIHRVDRSRTLYYEDIYRNFILINTSSAEIGQVNCLSVVKVGMFSYGHPTRLTASVHMGHGKIVDIQREIKLAGPSLIKGSLIIENFLASRYNPDHPFSLSASISFEQIYGGMDGDSASLAELCVLLSALSEVPIKQYLAITGSVNQQGEAQAVGGVNAKIEGFFDVCKRKGLTGKQGVIIPAVNAKNLMLREDVVQAAKEKSFFIYSVSTVDQAIALLTGLPAGKRNKKGEYPADSVNAKVEKKLQTFANNYLKKYRKKKK